MTPYEITQLDQERCEQQDRSAQEAYLDGLTDGAHSQLPQWNHEPYLRGYLEGVKRIPADPAGRVEHPNPHQHFAFGIVDSPDPLPGEF